MDRPLSSDRRDERRDFSSDRHSHHYGPGGGGGGYRGGRGRGGRGYHSRGRGRGPPSHHHHHQPYRRGGFNGGGGSGRGGPRRDSGNRFQADFQQHDPKLAALRQLQQLINKVGELELPSESTFEENSSQRPVVVSQTEKIKALTNFLCGPQAEMFLEYERDASVLHADKLAGPFVSSLIHCQSVLPLQTPCYAALTLSVHEHTTVRASPFAGVSDRCVEYALRFLARDLDHTLLEPACLAAESVSIYQDRPRAVARLRLTLRYLAFLAKIGIVAAQQTNDQSAVLAATNQRPVTLLGLLDAMVQAAIQATTDRYTNNKSVAYILAHLVWDTIPYIREMVSSDWILENLVDPLQETMEVYQSAFAPGIGSSSILLKAERHEDVGENGGEDDEEEDEDEEEDSGAVCDSFQDLLRTVKQSLDDSVASPRFALFSDAPWEAMSAPTAAVVQSDNTQEGAEQSMTEDAPLDPLAFTGQPKLLQLFPTCRVLTLLLGGDVVPETKLAKMSLDAIIVGRLPIFGPPSEAMEEDDDEIEDDTPVNEGLQCYRQNFGMVDRFFLGEAVRDCLLCHESTVTDTGVEHGSPKAVAEQIWTLRHALTGENAIGIEYCILEVILSLITQGDRGSNFRVMYLSRVLLELTRLEPTTFSPAIALGVSTLFEDYMPALVPVAAYNLSKWFAFHLTNTDYQWPSAYWKHWEPFVLFGWSNSRGSFVKGALTLMMENVSNVDLIVTSCLPKGSTIANQLVSSPQDIGDESLSSLVDEMAARIWEGSVDSDLLLNHFLSEEFSEALASVSDNKFVRTKVLFGALVSPAKTSWKATKNQIDKAISHDDFQTEMDESEEDSDPLSSILEKMDKLKNAILGVLEKEVAEQTTVRETESVESRDLVILELIMDATSYSRSFMEGCVMHCIRLNLVSVANVLKWCLGVASDGSTRPLVLRWWQMAGIALSTGISLLTAEIASSKANAMSDGDNESADKLVGSIILDYLDPLLSHMIQRVCQLLSLYNSEQSSKLSSGQVDLIEGFKYVLVECHGYYFSHVTRIDGTSAKLCSTSAMQDALTESPVSGQALAMLMDTSGSLAANHLRESLERM